VNSNSTAGLAELVADSNLKTITNRVWYLCFGETKLAKSTPHRLVRWNLLDTTRYLVAHRSSLSSRPFSFSPFLPFSLTLIANPPLSPTTNRDKYKWHLSLGTFGFSWLGFVPQITHWSSVKDLSLFLPKFESTSFLVFSRYSCIIVWDRFNVVNHFYNTSNYFIQFWYFRVTHALVLHYPWDRFHFAFHCL